MRALNQRLLIIGGLAVGPTILRAEELVWHANGALVAALVDADFRGVQADGYDRAVNLDVQRTHCEAIFSITGRSEVSPGTVSNDESMLTCRLVRHDRGEGMMTLSLSDWPFTVLALDRSLVVAESEVADRLFLAVQAAKESAVNGYVTGHSYHTAANRRFEMYSLASKPYIYSSKYLTCQRVSLRATEAADWVPESTRCVFFFPETPVSEATF